MPNTYSQLYIQFVFAVKFRKALLNPAWDERLRLYITAIVQHYGHKMLAINNVADHIHIFIGMSPAQAASDLIRITKADSSKWINSQHLTIKSKICLLSSSSGRPVENCRVCYR
jgi:putative transposase